MKTENSKNITETREVLRLSNLFAQQHGRRPRIMIAEPKIGALESDSKIRASIYADLGFDVDITPPFENAVDIAKQAIESDVHILSILIVKNYDYTIEIVEELVSYGRTDVMLILHTDSTEQDNSFLLKLETSAIFPKNLTTNVVARKVLEVLLSG